MRPRAQTMALAAIGVADLVTTLMFVGLANAAEANPIMAPFLERGPAAFIQAKLALLIVPLIVIEIARNRNPRFVGMAVNAAIAMYVVVYAVGVSHVNKPAVNPVTYISHNTQAQLDARRAEMGLPPARPLTILKRAEEQRRITSTAANRTRSRERSASSRTSPASAWPGAPEAARTLGLVEALTDPL